MIHNFKFIFLIYALFVLDFASTKSIKVFEDSLDARDLQPVGRSRVTRDQLELISSGVYFGFSFKGKQCRIFASIPASLDHNYLQFELDGVYQKRIRITKDNSQPIIINARKSGKHVIWIYKATEASTGPIYIQKVSAEDIQPVAPSTAPMIEFIGNSITCGAASDPSEVPCGSGEYHDQHNAYYAYGPSVAKILGLNYTLSSVSGIGIYRTWNRESPSMPLVYEKLDFLENGKRVWEFTGPRPKIVSIALGTNDLSNGDGKSERLPFDSARFVNDYVSFVTRVKARHAGAQIILLSSPMLDSNRRQLLENCISAVKNNIDKTGPGKKVVVYFFKPMEARGCTGHPNVEDHAVLAAELVPVIKKLIR